MRLAQVRIDTEVRPVVVLDDGRFADLGPVTAAVDGPFLERGLPALLADPRAVDDLPVRVIAQPDFAPPIARPGKIVCIGLNFADHAAESGMPVPAEPVVFFKAPGTLVGPDDDVRIPRGSVKTDWEVELGVVVGSECRYLASPAEARERIAGYVLSNDVSEREFQLERGGQWDKGKSCETFNPCGPWLVTPDEVPDVQALSMWLDVNGERRQTGSTATMVFAVDYLLWYLSQFMVLEPGDLINTGTPPGVALGMAEPRYLVAGDVMELGIEGLGVQRQTCVPAP
ncbi:MAG: fumarylacetoacetate hydrolase family protein [Candidatus Nanopelagicales bacterium]|jgi:2-keto-4-pentenoate hydratase/2-oxohepta-3-ene-1,7-dioic acid hydratase in catechol pathway